MTPDLLTAGGGALIALLIISLGLNIEQWLDRRELKRALRAEIDRADYNEWLAQSQWETATRLEADRAELDALLDLARGRVEYLEAERGALHAKLAKYDRHKGAGGKFTAKPAPAPVADQEAA